MTIRQLSVFIENRAGRMEEVTEVLAREKVNIVSFCLADTSEYGLLRMIVDDPIKGRNVLKENGFSSMLTDVIAVKLPQEIGTLNKVMVALTNVNIEYMYVLATLDDYYIIMKVDDNVKAAELLEKGGFELVGEEAYHVRLES